MTKVIFVTAGIIVAVVIGYFYFSGADGGGASGTFSDNTVDLSENTSSSVVVATSSSAAMLDGDSGDIGDSDEGGFPTIESSSAPATKNTKKDAAKKDAANVVGIIGATSTISDSSAITTEEQAAIVGNIISSADSEMAAAEATSSAIAPMAPAQACSFSQALPQSAAPRAVILNEIAWMGSSPQGGETTAKAGEREWIELKNISAAAVDLTGWQVVDSAGDLKIVLGTIGNGSSETIKIPADGFYLLVRDGASLVSADGSGSIQADAGYSGGLSNAGDKLALFDANCGTADFLDASAGWPAGNNTTKQTMERDADGIGWHTSIVPGGTPHAENSIPVTQASASATTPSTTSLVAPPTQPFSQFLVSVSSIGAGMGTVSSSLGGILCGFSCKANYDEGTKISFSETAAPGSYFKGWSGPCSGTGICAFMVSTTAALVADFEIIETSPPNGASSGDSSQAASSSGQTGSDGQSSQGHLVIAAIQIAGASSSNDFIKIFNPTSAAIDISNWKLHKKSSTGTDYSLRTFPTGATVAPGGYFVWANSLGGFSDSIGADASSTETLSADNSVALLDANGAVIDQVAWGTGTGQYVEGAAYPTDPTAGQILTRKTANGSVVDTDNNAQDFTID